LLSRYFQFTKHKALISRQGSDFNTTTELLKPPMKMRRFISLDMKIMKMRNKSVYATVVQLFKSSLFEYSAGVMQNDSQG